MTVYRITSDNNIIRVSSRNQTVKIVNNGRGVPGIDGEAATITVGTTTTLDPGTNATVTNVGTDEAAVFNFGIPRGDSGEASNLVTSVNGQQGVVVLDTDDINDTATNRYTNDSDITRLANTSGTNTGDQDLSGYATDSELTYGLALKEDTANKSTTTTLGISNTLFPTQNAVKTYVDTQDALKVSKSGDTMSGDLNMGDNDLNAVHSLSMDITPTIPTYGEGHIYWDENDKTLAIQQGVDDVTLQVGQEIYVRSRNSTGSTIANGSVVYISGATGNRPNITLAQANSSLTSNVIGMTTHAIENNTDGLVTIFGEVNDLDTSSYAEGDTLYLSPTVAGAMTTTTPTSPNLQVKVATVTRVNPANGTVLFRAQNIVQKADIGLGNVDNTSDANKPISTATQTALDGKVDKVATVNVLYGTDATGLQSPIIYRGGTATPSSIVQRNASGQILAADGTLSNHLVTLGQLNTATGAYVLKAGDTMTGALTTSKASSNTVGGINVNTTGNLVGDSQVITFVNNRGRIGYDAGTMIFDDNGTAKPINITSSGQTMRLNTNGLLLGSSSLNPTHTLTLPSTATGIAAYNTADQTTNYERFRITNSSNIYYLVGEQAGSGAVRAIRLTALGLSGGGFIQMNPLSTNGFAQTQGSTSTASSITHAFNGTYSAASGLQYGIVSNPVINQSATAGYTALLINPTETATGSGAKKLIDAQVGGISRLSIDNMGNMTMADLASGGNFIFGTTNGTQIGTDPAQKLAFFGNTPIAKQGATVDLGTVLSNFGLRTGGTAYPITTSGAVSFTGTTSFTGYTSTGTIRESPGTITATTTLTTTQATRQRVTASTAAINITLPTTTTAGILYRFYRTDATAQVVTILGTINGNAAGYVLSAQYKYVEVMSTTVSGTWEVWNSN